MLTGPSCLLRHRDCRCQHFLFLYLSINGSNAFIPLFIYSFFLMPFLLLYPYYLCICLNPFYLLLGLLCGLYLDIPASSLDPFSQSCCHSELHTYDVDFPSSPLYDLKSPLCLDSYLSIWAHISLLFTTLLYSSSAYSSCNTL